MQRIHRVWLALVVVAAFALAVPMAASAHERREVADGQYRFVVGFLDEPAFAGEKNGLDLRITKPGPADATPIPGEEEVRIPVEGLEATLQAEVIYGDQSMALPLSAAFRDPGAYESYFFPMAEGDYSFHISGEIEGVAVDETFTSSPDGFNSVEAREPLEFPKEEAKANGVVAGTVAGGGGDSGLGTGAILAGFAAGIAAGAAGLLLVVRRPFARPAVHAPVRA